MLVTSLDMSQTPPGLGLEALEIVPDDQVDPESLELPGSLGEQIVPDEQVVLDEPSASPAAEVVPEDQIDPASLEAGEPDSVEYWAGRPEREIVEKALEARDFGQPLETYRSAFAQRRAQRLSEGKFFDTGESAGQGFLRGMLDAAKTIDESIFNVVDRGTLALYGRGLISGETAPGAVNFDKASMPVQARAAVEMLSAAEFGALDFTNQVRRGLNHVANWLFRAGTATPGGKVAKLLTLHPTGIGQSAAASVADFARQFNDEVDWAGQIREAGVGRGLLVGGDALQEAARRSGGPLAEELRKLDTERVQSMSLLLNPGWLQPGIGGVQASAKGPLLAAGVLKLAEKPVAGPGGRVLQKMAQGVRLAEKGLGESMTLRATAAGLPVLAATDDPEKAFYAAAAAAAFGEPAALQRGMKRTAARLDKLALLPPGPMGNFIAGATKVLGEEGAGVGISLLNNTPFILGSDSEQAFMDNLAMTVGMHLQGRGIGKVYHGGLEVARSRWASGDRMPETRLPGKQLGKNLEWDAANAKVEASLDNASNNFYQSIRKLVGQDGELYLLDDADYAKALDGLVGTHNEVLGDGRAVPFSPATAEAAKTNKAGVTLTVAGADGEPRRVSFSRVETALPGLSLGHEATHLLERALSPEELRYVYDSAQEYYHKSGQWDAYKAWHEDQIGRRMSDDEVASEIFAEHGNMVLNALPVAQFGFDVGNKKFATVVYDAVSRGLEKIGAKVPELRPESPGIRTGLGIEPSARMASVVESVLRARQLDGVYDAPPAEASGQSAAKSAAKPTAEAPAEPRNIRQTTPKDLAGTAKGVRPGFRAGDKIEEGVRNPEQGGRLELEDAVVTKPLGEGWVEVAGVHPDTGERLTMEVPEHWLHSKIAAKAAETAPAAKPEPAPERGAPNIRTTARQQDQFGKATPELQAANRAKLDELLKRPRHEQRAVQLDYLAAEPESFGPNQGERQRQREAADAAEAAAKAAGAPNPLRGVFDKVTVPFAIERGQLLAWSADKLIRNVDLLQGWLRLNPEAQKLVDTAYLSSPELQRDMLRYLENLSHGYAGEGFAVKAPEDVRPGSVTAPDPSYTPHQLSADRANLLNLLQGLEQPEKITPALDFHRRMAELNGLRVYQTGDTVDPNPLRARLRTEHGWNAGKYRLLDSAVERLNLDRIVSPIEPRPDLSFRAGDTAAVQAGFMPGTGLKVGPPTEKTKAGELRFWHSYWLSPEGDFYPLEPFNTHSEWGARLLKDNFPEKAVEPASKNTSSPVRNAGEVLGRLYDLGWTRVTSKWSRDGILSSGNGQPNLRQSAALRDYAIEVGAERAAHDDGSGFKVLWSRNEDGALFMPETQTSLPLEGEAVPETPLGEVRRASGPRLSHEEKLGRAKSPEEKFRLARNLGAASLRDLPRNLFNGTLGDPATLRARAKHTPWEKGVELLTPEDVKQLYAAHLASPNPEPNAREFAEARTQVADKYDPPERRALSVWHEGEVGSLSPRDAALIRQIFDELPPRNQTVYRGFNAKGKLISFASLRPGELVHVAPDSAKIVAPANYARRIRDVVGYISTSADSNVALRFYKGDVGVFLTLRSSTAKSAETLLRAASGKMWGEKEHVIKAGTSFKIEHVERTVGWGKTKLYITASEVPGEAKGFPLFMPEVESVSTPERGRKIAGIRPGEWLSGWVTKNGDLVHGLGKEWGHHPDLLTDNPWLLDEAGVPKEQRESVIDEVASLDPAALKRLERRGLFAFAVEPNGKITFDSKEAPPSVREQVEKFVDEGLPRRGAQAMPETQDRVEALASFGKSWISPDGKLYLLNRGDVMSGDRKGEHETLAAEILGRKLPKTEDYDRPLTRELIDAGWLRVVTENGRVLVEGANPSPAQKALLSQAARDTEAGPDIYRDLGPKGDRRWLAGWRSEDGVPTYMPDTDLPPTGWVRPDGEYDGMSDPSGKFRNAGDWHLTNLQQHADEFAERFGLTLKNGGDDRFEALRKGFVRVRYDGKTGRMGVEAVRPLSRAVRAKIEDVVEANLDDIDLLDLNWFDANGKLVDRTSTQLFALDGQEKSAAALDALQSRQDLSAMPDTLDAFSSGDERRIKTALRRPGWAILTGTRSEHGGWDSPENVKANDALRAELAEEGLPFKEVRGRYKGVDDGPAFVVDGIAEKSALKLGKKYGQESVLTNRGYVYQDGSRNPLNHADTVFGDEARQRDGYTEFDDGTAFSAGIDFSRKLKPDVFGLPAWKEIARHLTEKERQGMRRDVAEEIVELHRTLPPLADFETAARMGILKQGWYDRASIALRTLFGDDTERFVGLLAALSPRQSVQQNLKMAVEAWKKWQEAGRPTEPKAILGLIGKDLELENRRQNAVRALRGEELHDLTPEEASKYSEPQEKKKLDEDAKLSGFKVESFRRNLLGDLSASTNDSWMVQFAGWTGDSFNTKARYYAFTAAVRRAAKKLGLAPAEVQETVWAFLKTAVEASSVDRPAEKTLSELTPGDIVKTPEFYDLIHDDPTIQNGLAQLGLLDLEGVGKGVALERLVDPRYAERRDAALRDPRPLRDTALPPEGNPARLLRGVTANLRRIKDAELAQDRANQKRLIPDDGEEPF